MKSLLLLLPFAALLSGCQTPPPTVSPATNEPDRFALADSNKDEKLSLSEASGLVNSREFAARDRDKNGSITPNECVPEEMGEFKACDHNGDGKVTSAEYSAHKAPERTAGFKNADSNNDGYLDRKEVNAYFAARE